MTAIAAPPPRRPAAPPPMPSCAPIALSPDDLPRVDGPYELTDGGLLE